MQPEESITPNEPKPSKKRRLVAVGALVVVALTLTLLSSGMPNAKQPAILFDPTNPMQEVPVKDIIAQGHSASGTIETIDHANKTFTFSATIADLSNYKKNDTIILRDLPAVSKTYTVRTTSSRTFFDGKQFADLTAGDTVLIQTKESIYEKDILTATTIKYWDEQKEQMNNVLGDPDILFGVVRTVTIIGDGATTLTVESEIPDKEKLLTMDLSGSYNVPYITKIFTVSVPVSLISQEPILGRMVRFTTAEDLYESTVLTATGLFLVP